MLTEVVFLLGLVDGVRRSSYTKRCFRTKKARLRFGLKSKASASEGGDAGNRTRVQTSNRKAFYMFSF